MKLKFKILSKQDSSAGNALAWGPGGLDVLIESTQEFELCLNRPR